MGKHGKNSCANPVFSYHERKQLKHWGTQQRRVGADEQLDHDVCSLCLHVAQEPLACHEGHIYCKGCVYESILSQKQFIKQQNQLYEQEIKKQQAKEEENRVKEEMQKVEKFTKLESSLLPTLATQYGQATKLEKESDVPSGYRAVKTQSGTIYVPEDTQERQKRLRELPCYWIPSLTPQGVETKVEKPNQHTMCPAAHHTLRLKQLRPLVFTYTNTDSTNTNASASNSSNSDDRNTATTTTITTTTNSSSSDSKYMCPVCCKSVTKVMTTIHLQVCGHVICEPCANRFTKQDLSCPVCGKHCSKSDVVTLQNGGSNFASNKSTVVKASTTPAFQCC